MTAEVLPPRSAACVATLAVLGDSTAEGVGDPVAGGPWRGFGPFLASALGAPGEVRLLNVGQSGARAACVRRDQLPLVLDARPQLAVLVVGLNDTLRADFDPAAVYADLSTVVAALTVGGATVLTVRFHDHGRILPLPRPLARALTDRIDRLNGAIGAVVREQGAHCLDLDALPGCYEPATWSVDRLHPSERGHRRLARGFADLLVAAGHPVARPEVLDGVGGPPPTRVEEVHWLVTRGVPWLCRRTGDLLPLVVRSCLGDPAV